MQLTPWSRVLPEKLKRPKLLKKFPAFYGTRRFITVFTTARHLSLFWARLIQSITPPPIQPLEDPFNSILPSTPGSSKWSSSHKFCYMSGSMVQVKLYASQNSVYTLWSNVRDHRRESGWHPNSDTSERGRTQHDCPAACVIAQQYSSADISLRLARFSKKFIWVFSFYMF
jgi:hypothetical protein